MLSRRVQTHWASIVRSGWSSLRRYATKEVRERRLLKRKQLEKTDAFRFNLSVLMELVTKYAPVTSPQLYELIKNEDTPLSKLPRIHIKRLLHTAVKARRLWMVDNPLKGETNYLINVEKRSIYPINPDICPNTERLQPIIEEIEEKAHQKRTYRTFRRVQQLVEDYRALGWTGSRCQIYGGTY